MEGSQLSQDEASLADDVESASKMLLKGSLDQELDQGIETAVLTGKESLQKAATEPGGLRVLAEDLKWGLDEAKAQDSRDVSKLVDELKLDGESRQSTAVHKKVEKTVSFEGNKTVNVGAAEETQVKTEIAEDIVEETVFEQNPLYEPTEETNVPPNVAESKLIKSVKISDIPKVQVTESPSQFQHEITVTQPAEEDEDMNMEGEILYLPQEIFLDIQEKLRDSRQEEKIEIDLQMKREDMLIKLHKTMAKNESLRCASLSLQSKIADYFKTKVLDKFDTERTHFATEDTYLSALGELQSMRARVENKCDYYRMLINDMKLKCKQKKAEVEAEHNKLMALMQNVIQGAVFSYTRKPMPSKDLEDYLHALSNKELEISKIRLGIMKLENKMERNKMVLRSKEELADGLRIQDFEQLKIENQTLNEKIEEKNVEMLKLKRKIASTVQVMTHCKEKLHYVQEDNIVRVNTLKVVEASLAESRDILAKLKNNRDVLKTENVKLRQDSGFLGNRMLLGDFEAQKKQIADFNSKLQEMKTRHLMLTQRCTKVRAEIKEVRKKTKDKKKLS